jgi:hypothetical protein
MIPRERCAYSAIVDRPPLENQRCKVYIPKMPRAAFTFERSGRVGRGGPEQGSR